MESYQNLNIPTDFADEPSLKTSHTLFLLGGFR